MAIGVPSSSIPVIASMASPMPGTLRAESICACETDPRSSTCRTALTRNAGATTGLSVVRNGPTAGSAVTSSMRSPICARPSGVSASPRKMMVTMLTRLESPNDSSISSATSAMGCPGGRKSTLAPSVGGAPKIRARSQNSGNAKQDDERYVRAGRDQPTQCTKQVVQGKTVLSLPERR